MQKLYILLYLFLVYVEHLSFPNHVLYQHTYCSRQPTQQALLSISFNRKLNQEEMKAKFPSYKHRVQTNRVTGYKSRYWL